MKAIFIDLDGTMFDTAPELVFSVNGMLKKFGSNALEFDVVRTFIGRGVDNLINQSISLAHIQDVNLEHAREAFNSIYVDLAEKSKPYPGVLKTLDVLKSKKIKLACITNKPSMHTMMILKKYGYSSIFDFILCGDEMRLKKPNAFPINYVRKNFSVSKEETMMVGDSVNDIKSAINAGVKIATVPYGYQGNEPIDKYSVDYKMKDFSDLLEIC